MTNGLANTAPAPTRVKFASSAVRKGALPALYTCDGKDTAPPLSWGAIPAKVEELVIFLLGAKTNKLGQTALSIEWGIAGLKPGLHHLSAGEIPHGAFLVTNSAGARRYSICPARGHTGRYSFALLALPAGARASPQFPGNLLFHNLTANAPEFATPASGAFPVRYTRR